VAGLILEASPTTLRDNAQLLGFVESVVSSLQDPISPDFARSFVADTSSEDVAPDMVDLLVEELPKVPAHVWKEAFAGLLQYDDMTKLPVIEAPTLPIWGDADALVSRTCKITSHARSPMLTSSSTPAPDIPRGGMTQCDSAATS
jgi:non-heme chloroperoxidase